MKPIKLIVGLGNPGQKYHLTRHNAGFDFIDELCEKNSISLKANNKFYGNALKTTLHEQSLWILRPETFVNGSGKSVAALANFYKIPAEQILVVYDELDLEPGVVKLKKSGGHGGHNGLRDIIDKLGSKDFLRLRIGIGHPGHKSKVTSWVLSRANSEDELKIRESFCHSMQILPDLLQGKFEKAMKDLHTQN